MNETILDCYCVSCGQHVEYPSDSAGQTITCPSCGVKMTLLRPAAERAVPRSPPPVPQAPPVQQPVRYGSINTKGEAAGSGCLVQGIGIVAMFFFFPIGLIAGAGLLLAGMFMSRYPVCSHCGNRLANRSVKMCPVCQVCFE